MTNLSVNFTNVWWLLLLIPAVGVTLYTYFKVNKRFRCTRNRVVSIVMHLVVTVLSALLLAGFTVEYYTPDTEVEVILLVDSSYTTEDTENDADDFVKTVIDNSDSMYKLGIVKFGYDQVYAVELTNNTDKVFSAYLSSDTPDTTATDIASALKYSASLFKNTENARIVLLTDALETDDSANDVIRGLAAKGISVDVVYFPGEEIENEIQIIDATQSEEKIKINTPFYMNVTLQSSFTGTAEIIPYDNNVAGTPVTVELTGGKQTVSIPYSFAWGGMHVTSFEIKADDDTVSQNNGFFKHIYIETFTEVLVVESIPGESQEFVNSLGEELNVKVVDIDGSDMPTNINELRDYDTVVLFNIANKDLPAEFDVMLYDYVYNVGGGLFTVCGNDEGSTETDWTANAYTREDMYGTLYQQMLPVEIVNYTAPVGVIIVVDTSGSMMGSPYDESKLYWAMQGAQACLDALTERDHVGIMTLADSYTEELTLTPRTQRDKILAAIADLEESAIDGTIESGGTIYSAALERAGKALGARSDIEKKHIIMVTDGEPAESDAELYLYWAQENAKLGVTMSIVGIETSPEGKTRMEELLEYAGCDADNFHAVAKKDYATLPIIMREDLEVPEIKSVNYETFTPTINSHNAITSGILQKDMPTLDGYYGVKLKKDATAVLMGNYTPIYSQWSFGNGRVGTFACDLSGTWSKEFLASEVGKKLLNNIIYDLFPTENIRATGIEAAISGDNYTTNLSIYTDLADGETVKVTVTSPGGEVQEFSADKTTGYSRMTFAVKESGLHTVFVQRLSATGEEISSTTVYKTLSYSKEYDAFADTEAALKLAESLTASSDGVIITDPLQVFDNAVEYLHIVIDPRIAFAIIIIVCFLLDIVVRKFKWKWPHEIIRDRKSLLNAAK